MAATEAPEERAQLEAKLRRLELAYEVARGGVMDVSRERDNAVARKRLRLEMTLGGLGIICIVGIGIYLYLTMTHPQALKVDATADERGKVVLSWKVDAKQPVNSFVVVRSIPNADSGSQVINEVKDPKARTYEDDSVDSGTQYNYEVYYLYPSGGEEMKRSDIATVSVTTPPPPPQERRIALVSPMQGNNEHGLTIKWILPQESEEAQSAAVRLERSTNGEANWEPVATFEAGRDRGEFNDTSLPADAEYFYRTVATDSTGEQASQIKSGRTLPEAPSHFKAEATSDRAVKLSWANVIPDGYKVVLRDPTGERDLNPQEILHREIIDSNVEAAATRQYSLVIRNAEGKSSKPAITKIQMPPASPSGLHAVAWGPQSCEIQWDRALTGAKSFEIYRADGEGSEFRSIGNVVGTDSRFTDKTVRRGNKYTYKVAARNSGGLSDFSNPSETISMIMPRPEPPRINSRQGGTVGTVQIALQLTAKDLPGLKRVVVERATSADGPFSPIREFTAPIREQEVAGDQQLLPGKEYFYRALAYAEDYDTPFISALESVVVKKVDAVPATKTKAAPGAGISPAAAAR